MSFELFITVFLEMLIVGTLAITGWYLITRGGYEVQPDNTIKKTGNIFKGFYFFFIREKKEKKRIYYKDRQLELLFANEIKPIYQGASNLAGRYEIQFMKRIREEGAVEEGDQLWEVQKAKMEEVLNIKIQEVQVYSDMVYAVIFAEFPNYVFPEWVRDPIAVCPTCMASVYGSITYFSWLAITRTELFAWSSMPLLASFLFWMAFCFSLSVTNTFIAKTVQK